MFAVSGIVASVRTYPDRRGQTHVQVVLVEELAGALTASWKKNGGALPVVGAALELRPRSLVVNRPPYDQAGPGLPVLLCEEPAVLS